MITTALPKLSADQIEDLFRQLGGIEPRIARTILITALRAAEPRSAAYQFLQQYRTVVAALQGVELRIGRTLAIAAFNTRNPTASALEYLKYYRELVGRFENEVPFGRSVALAAFRSADSVKAAEKFIEDYYAIVSMITAEGVEGEIARTLAGIACRAADRFVAARKLMLNFQSALTLVQKIRPSIARSIALAACRATNPLEVTRTYIQNYDAIVRFTSQTDPDLAHRVAHQVFRSKNPEPWARRYLKQLKAARRQSNLKILIPFVLAVELLSRTSASPGHGDVLYAASLFLPMAVSFRGSTSRASSAGNKFRAVACAA